MQTDTRDGQQIFWMRVLGESQLLKKNIEVKEETSRLGIGRRNKIYE
jgi:hypothetical protein